MKNYEKAIDDAYDHIQRDIDNPDFQGIPGTSGTPEEGIPIEFSMPQHLDKLKTLKEKGVRQMPIVQNQTKVELMMAVYRSIFGARKESMMDDLTNAAAIIHERCKDFMLRINPRLFKDSTTGVKDVPGFDVTCDFGDQNPNGTMKVRALRFIAQNPNKRDANGNLKENAILAQTGHRIMWAIDTAIENGFMGKVMDDQWIPNAPRATYAARNGATQAADVTGRNYQKNEGNWVQNLPNIDPKNTINMVEEYLNADEECEFDIEEL